MSRNQSSSTTADFALTHAHLIVNERRIAYVHSPAASSDSKAGVLFCGGFNSNMQGLKALAIEQYCLRNDLSFTRFDYNGHGQSDGQFTDGDIGSWTNDAIEIFDQVACATKKSHGPNGVIVIGSSMGAWIATLLARQRSDKISGLVTLAAAPDFTEKLLLPSLSEKQRATLESGQTLYLPSNYDDGSPYPISANLITSSRTHLVLDKPFALNAPLRLIHGTSDHDVPHQLSCQLMNTILSEDTILTLIKNADHRLSTEAELKVIIQTLESLLT